MGDDDEVKVGTEALATHESAEQNTKTTCTSTMIEAKKVDFTAKQSPAGASGKRKASKSASFEGTQLQITRKGSELGKNLDEQCTDRIRKSPVQIKKTRVGNEITLRKVKSDSAKAVNERIGELRKMKSEPRKDPNDENFKNSPPKPAPLTSPVGAKNLAPIKIVTDEDMNKSDEDLDGRIQESANSECKDLEAIRSNEDQILSITKKNLDISINLVEYQKPKKVVIKEKKFIPSNDTSAPIAPVIKKEIHANIHPKRVSDKSHENPSKIKSLADLIMWKDVSRSTFVFGVGSFAIISSSYTKDLNISLISVLSYLGLVYLGVSFISKSIITRGNRDVDNINQEYVFGEEEAIWVVKLFLPYVNEFLVKLRGLFAGDPPTTMKLAVLLFIIARCGGSITIWKMTKLGFFGAFMVPKFCSSYSSHLAAYGSFWIRRFGDAWESCSHKRAVGLGIVTLLWNQSSAVARIWGLFLLFVTFKYYQQYHSWMKEEPNSNANQISKSTTTPTIAQTN